jgi:DNA-binding NarL/FixJ family response regulator
MTNGILIEDDNSAFRGAVRAYLTQQNFKVCGEAVDGANALEKATELAPALITLDLRMPNMNGVEAASVLKGRMPDVRIVLLTMYDEVVGYKSLMSAIGVDAAIAKTDCFNSLAECVRGLLSSPAPRGARDEQNQQAQETGSGLA